MTALIMSRFSLFLPQHLASLTDLTYNHVAG